MTMLSVVEALERDLRSAYRSLRADPAFAIVVLTVLTLAMGTTVVYSVVDAVTLRGVPFDRAHRLKTVTAVSMLFRTVLVCRIEILCRR